MINRFMKGFIIISLGFMIGCGGLMQKTKTFVQSPFGKKEETSQIIAEESQGDHMEIGKNLFMKGLLPMSGCLQLT